MQSFRDRMQDSYGNIAEEYNKKLNIIANFAGQEDLIDFFYTKKLISIHDQHNYLSPRDIFNAYANYYQQSNDLIPLLDEEIKFEIQKLFNESIIIANYILEIANSFKSFYQSTDRVNLEIVRLNSTLDYLYKKLPKNFEEYSAKIEKMNLYLTILNQSRNVQLQENIDCNKCFETIEVLIFQNAQHANKLMSLYMQQNLLNSCTLRLLGFFDTIRNEQKADLDYLKNQQQSFSDHNNVVLFASETQEQYIQSINLMITAYLKDFSEFSSKINHDQILFKCINKNENGEHFILSAEKVHLDQSEDIKSIISLYEKWQNIIHQLQFDSHLKIEINNLLFKDKNLMKHANIILNLYKLFCQITNSVHDEIATLQDELNKFFIFRNTNKANLMEVDIFNEYHSKVIQLSLAFNDLNSLREKQKAAFELYQAGFQEIDILIHGCKKNQKELMSVIENLRSLKSTLNNSKIFMEFILYIDLFCKCNLQIQDFLISNLKLKYCKGQTERYSEHGKFVKRFSKDQFDKISNLKKWISLEITTCNDLSLNISKLKEVVANPSVSTYIIENNLESDPETMRNFCRFFQPLAMEVGLKIEPIENSNQPHQKKW